MWVVTEDGNLINLNDYSKVRVTRVGNVVANGSAHLKPITLFHSQGNVENGQKVYEHLKRQLVKQGLDLASEDTLIDIPGFFIVDDPESEEN